MRSKKTDTTARRRTSRPAPPRDPREESEWILLALESARTGVWDWDLTTDLVRYIAPFAGTGDGAHEIRETRGADWSAATHPDDQPAALAAVKRAIEGESDEFESFVRMLRPPYREGDWMHIHTRGKILERDENGRATRAVGAYGDATAFFVRREREHQLDLALAQATKMASLGALASSVAHEINQPLAALTSFLEAAVRMLDKQPANLDAVAESLRRSVALAERASKIVLRLRRLLRRDSPLQERFDAAELLLAVKEHTLRESEAAGVDVRVITEEDRCPLLGDRVQIEQAVGNLVRNAVQALANSSRESRVVTMSVRRSNSDVEIVVTDNGQGIPDAERDRLFEPFFTTKATGTGLGLVICQSIAEIHGGRVRLDRSGPDGTVFVLTLPAPDGGENE